MKLKVKLDSYTLCGSGEGAGLIDSDVVFDAFGFPYLPGRRMKGLLRESAQEVLEMLGKEECLASLLHSLFGNGGFEPGRIRIPNLRLPDYEKVTAYAGVLLKDTNMSLVTRANILVGFTDIREQTALDEDGIADESSLRITRVLCPGRSFKAKIADLPEPEAALLFLAAHNLKRMGTSRNRGQGKITCKLKGAPFDSVNKAIARLALPSTLCGQEMVCNVDKPATAIGEIKKVRYTVTLKSPLVISKPIGDENTVTTNNYLPGNVIKGLIAARIMAKRRLTKANAHLDDMFYHLLLPGSGALSITSAFPSQDRAVFCHTPMSLHTDKSNTANLFNMIVDKEDEKDAKYQREMIAICNKDVITHSVDKTLFFHTTRGDNRVKGKSDEGGLFFYEAIDSGQQFTGWLWGTENTLETLIGLVGDKFNASIGRSRSAQYGDAEIQIDLLDPKKVGSDDIYDTDIYGGDAEFLLSVLSPVIFYNESGISELGTARLESWLTKSFGVDVKIINAFARLTTVESFVGVWGMKMPRDVAYEEGSTFLVRIDDLDPETRTRKVKALIEKGFGERTDAGFGRVRVLNLDQDQYQKKVQVPNNKYPDEMPTALREIIKNIVQNEIRQRIVEAGIKNAEEYRTKPLTNHQIGRLEQMLIGLDRDAFLKAIGSLRPTAGKKMETCKNKARLPILDSLKKYDEEIKNEIEILTSNSLKKIMKQAGLQENNVVNRDELARDYWVSLLRKMRKDNKIRRA
jgi:CRISPR-associated protein Csx10